MPSQMSGINGKNNRYNYSRIVNYPMNGSNNGMDQGNSLDTVHVREDLVSFNKTLSSNNSLDQGMVESALFSTTTPSHGIMEEYRMRLGSEDLGLQRALRRANILENDLDLGSMYISPQPIFSTNLSQWSQECLDESKLRDVCARDAQQLGFIVGDELEMVKAKSHRSVIQNTPDRIISSFKDRYGQSDSSSKKTYLQLGVRVPTKEHVSEIVGKQGSKIKQIREKTGALITTPGEQEDHVFIIEAPPRTALHVAQILKSRAEDITMSRTQECRRRSSCPVTNNNRHSSKSPAIGGFSQCGTKVILASGRIQVPKIIVGRIIGTQGSIITTIQRDTGTEIRSPPKEIGKPKHTMADFEILVYQTANLADPHEARQRVQNAKQLIAHVAMHQLEKIRAEEAPYSNYQVLSSNSLLNDVHDEEVSDEDGSLRRSNNTANDIGCLTQHNGANNKEYLLTEQLRPFDWMWSDISKLDDCLAIEVVDRILEESKKKTKTRSEPSICDTHGNSLFTLGESDNFSNETTEVYRPRHSLPETRLGTISTNGVDCLYRSNIQNALPYSANDNFLLSDLDSNFRSSPSMSFITRRSDLNEHELLDLQSKELMDNQSYHNSSQFPHPRDLDEPTLMHHMFLNSGDLSENGFSLKNSSRNMARYVIDPNFSNYSNLDGNFQNSLNRYAEDNGQWGYNSTNGSQNANPPHNCHDPQSSSKSYADSVRPLHGAMCHTHSTIHGTIGDHLKKTMSYHFKG